MDAPQDERESEKQIGPGQEVGGTSLAVSLSECRGPGRSYFGPNSLDWPSVLVSKLRTGQQ